MPSAGGRHYGAVGQKNLPATPKLITPEMERLAAEHLLYMLKEGNKQEKQAATMAVLSRTQAPLKPESVGADRDLVKAKVKQLTVLEAKVAELELMLSAGGAPVTYEAVEAKPEQTNSVVIVEHVPDGCIKQLDGTIKPSWVK